jgi:transposase
VTVSTEQEVEIRRLYYAEHWKVGTIASQLSVHADVVRRVLGLLEHEPGGAERPRLVEPYEDFILETLHSYPRLRATRLYDMVRARGYEGSVRTLREHVARVRPAPKKEAYLRVEPLIGEQAQVDWAHVGQVPVAGGLRALWLFVQVLSWSRALWGEFVLDLGAHSLTRSLVRAAGYFGGTPRQWLFDNPKAVVLQRHGEAVRFHPQLLEVAGHYRVQPKVCAVRKANQKGKVERAIRYLRERFLAGRTLRSVEQGNQELWTFLKEVDGARAHPVQPGRTVAECLAHAHATLTLVADDTTVRLLNAQQEVARHARCWGKRQVLEAPEHRESLLALKRQASQSKGQDRLRSCLPGVDVLFARWVEAGRNVGTLTAATLRLLDAYGAPLLNEALAQVLSRGTHDPGALAAVCEQRRRAKGQPLPLELHLGSHVPDRDVTPHSLERYDEHTRRRD